MTTDDLEDVVQDGIYGDDRMTSRQLDDAFGALTELVRRLEAAERRADDADHKRRQADAEAIRCAANDITAGLDLGDAVTVFGRLHALADAIERGEHLAGGAR